MKHILIPTLALCASVTMVPATALVAHAAIDEQIVQPQLHESTYEERNPRLFTQLSLNIRSSETGYVEGYVKNTFTFFPSQVYVRLYLYSSPTYTTDINQMTVEMMKITPDLDMGVELVAKASTKGEKKYWCAYMQYSADGGEVKTGQTDTLLFDANGQIAY